MSVIFMGYRERKFPFSVQLECLASYSSLGHQQVMRSRVLWDGAIGPVLGEEGQANQEGILSFSAAGPQSEGSPLPPLS